MCRETRTTTPGTVQIKRMCGHTGVPAEAGTGQRPPVDRTQCPRHPREHTAVQSWHHEGSTLQDVSSTYFSGPCRGGATTGLVQEAPGLTGRYEAGSRGHERERGTPAVDPDRGSPLRIGTLQQQGHPHTVQKGHGLQRQGHPHTHCRKGTGRTNRGTRTHTMQKGHGEPASDSSTMCVFRVGTLAGGTGSYSAQGAVSTFSASCRPSYENCMALKRAFFSNAVQIHVGFNRRSRTEYVPVSSGRTQHPWQLRSSSWRARCK